MPRSCSPLVRAPGAVALHTLHDVATDGSRWQSRERQDARLALALAAGLTWKQAAAEAGLTERTAYRRGDDPEFRAQVDALAADGWRQAAARLEELVGDAAARLGVLLTDPDPRIALTSAKAILDVGGRVREQAELVDRIEALEARRPDPRLRSVA